MIVAGEKLWLDRGSIPGPFIDHANHSTTELPSHPDLRLASFSSKDYAVRLMNRKYFNTHFVGKLDTYNIDLHNFTKIAMILLG